jgi:hypothetical protein
LSTTSNGSLYFKIIQIKNKRIILCKTKGEKPNKFGVGSVGVELFSGDENQAGINPFQRFCLL